MDPRERSTDGPPLGTSSLLPAQTFVVLQKSGASPVPFTICALTVFGYFGSLAESDKDILKEEHKAVQRMIAGPYNAIPSNILRQCKSTGSFWMLTEFPSRVSLPVTG